eukprot:4956778-Pyramimonas_sp.AAC.3
MFNRISSQIEPPWPNTLALDCLSGLSGLILSVIIINDSLNSVCATTQTVTPPTVYGGVGDVIDSKPDVFDR